ncbi:MAG: hypothetical protein WC541_04460 [Dehalococcoidia bacterium]
MASIKITATCKDCGWKKSGTIKSEQANVMAETLKWLKENITQHNIHGLLGNWDIKYSGPTNNY